MTEILEPCPFCGGKAKLWDLTQVPESWVECTECGARTRFFSNSEEAAVSAWNDRQVEEDLNKEIGRLIGTCHDLRDIVKDFRAERDQKDLEIKRLREALELITKSKFYFARGEEEKQIRRVCEIAEEALKGKEE